MKRVSKVLGHLSTTPAVAKSTASFSKDSTKRDDDIVIISSKRTAICKARRGLFKDTTPQELLAPCLAEVAKSLKDKSVVKDIVVGTVLESGSLRHIECRQAAFLAGFGRGTNLRTVNRQCSSGLQAIVDVATDIRAGIYDVGIAAGLETMTANAMAGRKSPQISDEIKANEDALNCLLPMGITSENVAVRFGVTREEMDAFATESHKRAFAAREKFKAEIVPITARVKDADTGKWSEVTVDFDDGVRETTTVAGLGKLRPVFKKGGTTTAGNSSQVSDGASATLITTRARARELGLTPIATLRHYAVSGVDPAVMGIGPAFAIPDVLAKAGLTTSDIDLYEINEAFASQAVYCVKKLGLSPSIVNVNGGALAFGHPLGDTGCRMVATLLHELQRRGGKRGIVSMCIGSGMGAAAIFELE
jgi:acetyl-CoA acyltransferase 1